MTGLIAIGVFGLGVLLVAGIGLMLLRLPDHARRRQLDRRIHDVTEFGPPEAEASHSVLIKREERGALSAVDDIAKRTVRGSAAQRWILQAGSKMGVGALAVRAIAAGSTLGAVAMWLSSMPLLALAGMALGLTLPVIVLKVQRTRRLRRFEEQFPEALDLMARALRAGHGFSNGLKMVAEEDLDPVSAEFRKTFDEQNFGLPLPDALFNLTERVPVLDVKLFVTAVLIQRDTGGNLAEIFANLADVVRERFKILRQVRVSTAHGRMTGYVLLALPAALSIVLLFINPDHMKVLFQAQLGKSMLLATLILQVVGYVWIKRVIKIEV